MGGMGFIHSAECEIMRNNVLINVNMVDAAAEAGVGRYFFSSSVCVYRDMALGEPELTEADAYPALPDNEYGWEKLYAERVAQAYGAALRHRRPDRPVPELLRPRGHLARRAGEGAGGHLPQGGRGRRTAATIEVWGDGSAVRSYTYVDDMVDGIVLPDRVRPRGPGRTSATPST